MKDLQSRSINSRNYFKYPFRPSLIYFYIIFEPFQSKLLEFTFIVLIFSTVLNKYFMVQIKWAYFNKLNPAIYLKSLLHL